jgi:hypothetical protein
MNLIGGVVQEAARTATLTVFNQMTEYNRLLKKVHPPTPKLDKHQTVINKYSQFFDTTTTTAILARGLNFALTMRHLPTEDISAEYKLLSPTSHPALLKILGMKWLTS